MPVFEVEFKFGGLKLFNQSHKKAGQSVKKQRRDHFREIEVSVCDSSW